MNPGKLSDMEVPNLIFAPSFNLLDLEARILHHGSLRDLALKISNCIRCGKCKTDCCVFYPQKNLFFHPRNKNLAIASLIEASLYDAQKFRSTKFEFLKHLSEIADHCTICHKCCKPRPVDIDTGEISIMERDLLETRRIKHTALITDLTLRYLESRSHTFNAAFRKIVIQLGGSAQRNLSKTLSCFPRKEGSHSPVYGLLSSPVPPASSKTFWEVFPGCGNSQALLIPAEKAERTVFYFPGCGSERLFSSIGKASVYILLKSNTSVILPPPFLCCGFPAKVNAKTKMESRITLRNIIFLTQIRETFGHLSLDACVVSCGTCREALLYQKADEILQAKIMDVSAFCIQNGFPLPADGELIYHQPCHDSLEGKAEALFLTYGQTKIKITSECCAEAGTMSLSRPDITGAMRNRKENSLLSIKKDPDQKITILTNCPSCIQGLGRHAKHHIHPRHIAHELALQTGGEKWENELRTLSQKAEAIQF
jgi:Fe-S oxidoreductase